MSGNEKDPYMRTRFVPRVGGVGGPHPRRFWEPNYTYAVAVMRKITILDVPGRYQLLARYFWQVRDGRTVVL